MNIDREDFRLPKRVFVYDSTLRDGEQTPGVALTVKEKVIIAKQLEKLGVDIIEAGFPANSKGEMEAVRRISKEISNSRVSGLSRVLKKDIDACIDCDVDLIHTFVSTSDVHLKYQMKKTREEIYPMAVDAVEYIKEHGLPCLFSAMDATRTDMGYLLKILKGTEEAGADIINIPDTVGFMVPTSMRKFMGRIRDEIDVVLDVHCHNDYGLAVANTLAAVEAGAEEVQVTVNGIGERAGNAALEPTVVVLLTVYGVDVNIEPRFLTETSQLVERYTGVTLSPCTPIVGRHAFAHESGIHVHALIGKASTFESINPADVGQKRRFVIGKLTGRHSIKIALDELGIVNVPDETLLEITRRVKDLAERNKLVSDVDLISIVEDTTQSKMFHPYVTLEELVVTSGLNITPSATVKLKINGEEKIGQGTGVGPVDAAANAIEEIVGPIAHLRLQKFDLSALTGGTNALGVVRIAVEDRQKNVFEAGAVHEDIVVASVNAFVQALNKAMYAAEKSK
ncbi:2-isopropylmalate synthase [Candidatus Bathyarchaeota archaeon]|nr:2-isopropylmalate synthase [Candidatus Bathyarchaeota archaeon]